MKVALLLMGAGSFLLGSRGGKLRAQQFFTAIYSFLASGASTQAGLFYLSRVHLPDLGGIFYTLLATTFE